MKKDSISIGTVKKKYRIIIQQRTVKGDKKETMRSFMIYDYSGKTKIDKIKEKLMQVE